MTTDPAINLNGDSTLKSPGQTPNSMYIDTNPKKPLNAFMLFARRRRPQLGGKVADSSKILGAEWKKMRAVQKNKYCAEAQFLRTSFRKRFPDFKLKRRVKRKPLKSDGTQSACKEKARSTEFDSANGVKLETSGNTPAPVPRSLDGGNLGSSPHSGLWLEDYRGSFKSHWVNPYPYEGNTCLWEIDDKWGRLLDNFGRIRAGVV
ncbi:hypothetical protein B0H11DRAFT_1912798 [Mycena galericulata]|nr:hypothetical protein B0H11DRAFT_1912798 [Mycena galericulata]